ncbi:MAG: GtrA family protein [Bacilli bacterium]|nr:GtrA family protein [Bacilli bacterium]
MDKKEKNKELLRAIKFTLISISAGIIQTLVFTVLNLLTKSYWLSHLPSLIISVIWNFTINRKITFKSANNIKKAMLLVLLFYVVFTPASTLLGNVLEQNGVNDFVIEVIMLLSNFILEYLYCRFIVYHNSCDTATK